MDEFQIKLPKEYFKLIFKDQNPWEAGCLCLDVGDNKFLLRLSSVEEEGTAISWQSPQIMVSCQGYIKKIKTEKDKLMEKYEALRKEADEILKKMDQL